MLGWFLLFPRQSNRGESDTNNEAEPDQTSSLLTVEVGIRLIEHLVAKGILSEEDAIGVYINSLAGIAEPERNPAALRIIEAITRNAEPR